VASLMLAIPRGRWGWWWQQVGIGEVRENGMELGLELGLLCLKLGLELVGDMSHLLLEMLVAMREILMEGLHIGRVLVGSSFDHILEGRNFMLQWLEICLDKLCDFRSEGGKNFLFKIGSSGSCHSLSAVIGGCANGIRLSRLLLFWLTQGVILGGEILCYGVTV